MFAASVIALALTGGQVTAQGSCLGSAVTIPGTTGDDVVVGTDGDDVISAMGGNDVVAGGAGNDKICVGEGNDTAQGGDGDDVIEGGPGDDTLAGDFLESSQAGTGDDDVAGGEGNDIVVGDVANSSGTAAGEGDDKVNGGSGNDIVVGDAFSSALSAGTGDDDLDLGPGTDLAVGDALTGTPVAPAEPPSGAAAEAGIASPMALGTGGDVVNAQTETDLIVGDAAIFGPETGARRGGAVDALAECSKLAARRIALLSFLGLSDEEILDLIPDDIKSEFQEDMLIGDCMGVRARASGATSDNLNAGTEDDLSVGDNVSTDGSSGRQSGVETHLGGKGNDVMLGDNADARVISSSPSQFDLEILRTDEGDATADIFAAGEPRGATIIGVIYQNSFDLNLDLVESSLPRSAPQASRGAGGGDSGGKDHVRGGKGKDFLEGGPKKDKCSGGPQKDTFVETGPNKCEEITGAP